MVLEGFLEKEEKVEDRGLGVGSLSRDFTVGMCPSYLVTGGTQLGFRYRSYAGSRTGLGEPDWQTLACRHWRIIEGSVREWPGQSWALEKKGGQESEDKLHALYIY